MGYERYEVLFVIVQRGFLSWLLLYVGVFLRMRVWVFRTERDVILNFYCMVSERIVSERRKWEVKVYGVSGCLEMRQFNGSGIHCAQGASLCDVAATTSSQAKGVRRYRSEG
jgi:hypothetical protein